MAARRSRSSSRRSGGGATSERKLQPDASGRYPAQCPRCGAGYKIPEELLDERVTCKNCKAVFTPRNLLTKSGRATRARKSGSSGLVAAGVGAVLLIGFFVLINSMQEEKPEEKEPEKQIPILNFGHPAWKVYGRFLTAAQSANTLQMQTHLAIKDFYKSQGGEQTWALIPKEDRDQWLLSWIETQKADVKTNWLLESKPLEMLWRPQVPEGTKELTYEASLDRLDGQHYGDTRTEVKVKLVDGAWKIADLKVLEVPHIPAPVSKKKKTGYHEKLGKGRVEEVKDKETGKTFAIRVIDPKPLEHLKETPEPMRRRIDQLLAQIKDPNLPGGKLGKARRELVKIGVPAIPRILTQFYETRTQGLSGDALQDSLNYLGILTRMLRSITNHGGYGYHPMRSIDGGPGVTDKERDRALKAWFGWYSKIGWKMTQEHFEEERKKAEDEIGMEEWEDHRRRKKAEKGKGGSGGTKPPSGGK